MKTVHQRWRRSRYVCMYVCVCTYICIIYIYINDIYRIPFLHKGSGCAFAFIVWWTLPNRTERVRPMQKNNINGTQTSIYLCASDREWDCADWQCNLVKRHTKLSCWRTALRVNKTLLLVTTKVLGIDWTKIFRETVSYCLQCGREYIA